MPTQPLSSSSDLRSDHQLALAVQGGTAAAFAELVRRHERRLRALAFGNPRWAARGEEMIRQTWQAAERAVKEGRFRGGEFRPWLFKVADAVAVRLFPGPAVDPTQPSAHAELLMRCLGKLRAKKPAAYQVLLWVACGLNRSAIAKRKKLTKDELNRRYALTAGAVGGCVRKETGGTTKLLLERIPFSSSALPAWLERQLGGDKLGDFTDELLALRKPSDTFDLDEWLGPHRDGVLSRGLAALPRGAIRQLLAYPPALAQLQRLVLTHGGRHWDQTKQTRGFYSRLDATRPGPPPPTQKVFPLTPPQTPPPTVRLPPLTPTAPSKNGSRNGLIVGVLAVVVLLAVVAGAVVWAVSQWNQTPPPAATEPSESSEQ